MEQTNSSTSNFRKFAFKILLPCLALIIGVSVLFTYIFEKYVILGTNLTGAYKVNRIFNHYDSTETPIFGYSHSFNGLIPDSIGNNFFNYALLGAGQQALNAFFKVECSRKKTSPLIISDLPITGFETSIGNLDGYIYNANDPRVKEIMGSYYKWTYSVPVIKYFGRFEIYIREFMDLKAQKVYTNKGSSLYKEQMDSFSFRKAVERRMESHEVFVPSPALEKDFFSIINANPNRFFVFIITPVHKSFFNKFEFTPELYAFIKHINSLPNARVFNFSREKFPDSLFYDTVHLDYQGAIKLSKQLKDSLASLNIPAITRSLRK